jgi:hypothetical protein
VTVAGPEQAGGIDLGAGTNPAAGLDRGPVDWGAGLDRGAGLNHGPHR